MSQIIMEFSPILIHGIENDSIKEKVEKILSLVLTNF